MTYRQAFSKTIGGDFDRIDITSKNGSDWLDIEMRVGHDVERIRMTLRNDEAVRDLHYALGRYLAHVDKASNPPSSDVLEALADCASILPRYRHAGQTTLEDEELYAVLERVRAALKGE